MYGLSVKEFLQVVLLSYHFISAEKLLHVHQTATTASGLPSLCNFMALLHQIIKKKAVH